MNDFKVLGIAAEYNPFHNGHKYHIEKSKEITGATHTVAVMSGAFVQRGIPAVCDKWQRAYTAVKNGADLVLELPFVYACNGASFFAKGAVSVLEGLGCVSYMSFGSESGDIEALKNFAFKNISFEKNNSYAKGMGDALKASGISSDSNNILALEYIRKLKTITPVTIKRSDSGYFSDDIKGEFASASKIRKLIYENDDITEKLMPEKINPAYIPSVHDENIFKAASLKILSLPAEILDKAPSAGEGIGNRMKNVIRRASSLEELNLLTRQGRYTKSRINRSIIQITTGLYKDFPEIYYARVLAFNEKGAEILKYIKKSKCQAQGFKIITNINKEDISLIYPVLKYDILANDIYNLITERDKNINSDYVKSPLKVFDMKGNKV